MKIPDNPRKSAKIYEKPWKSTSPWKSTKIPENPRKSVKIYENPRKSMKLHEKPWKSTKIHENPRKSTEIHENPRKSTKINENPRKSTKFSRIFLDFHGFVLIFVPGFSRILVPGNAPEILKKSPKGGEKRKVKKTKYNPRKPPGRLDQKRANTRQQNCWRAFRSKTRVNKNVDACLGQKRVSTKTLERFFWTKSRQYMFLNRLLRSKIHANQEKSTQITK